MKTQNNTMMQYFEWYIPSDAKHWERLAEDSNHLKELGINYVWLPPAYKGASGKNDVGYGVYDLYDLGEFDQKGSVPTKYGTKEEYINAIDVLRKKNIKVIVDIVLNHKMGADETEEVLAVQEDFENRNVSLSEARPIKAWTKYTFPGRGDTYSDFKWNWTHFHGVDWDDSTGTASIYQFYGKHWDENVDKEKGNFDYLMGADIDLNNHDVVVELQNWGKWYLEITGADGVRLDAVKHIRSEFFPEWLEEVSKKVNKELFVVGEYWSTNIDTIKDYLDKSNGCMKLFDVPLHYNFYRAATSNGAFDLRTIFDGTLVQTNPEKAVTFVDNHDTQIGQALESWIPDWFKPIAYSLICLRKDGLPCVFYGDYYGIPEKEVAGKSEMLDKILETRKLYAYGEQVDYFENPNLIGFVRKGDFEHPNSGIAVVMTDTTSGTIKMNMGTDFAGREFYDCLGNRGNVVTIDEEGNGEFSCSDGSVSVWRMRENVD